VKKQRDGARLSSPATLPLPWRIFGVMPIRPARPTGYDGFVTTSRATRLGRSQPNYSGSANVSHRLVEMAALTATDIDRWLGLRASNAQLDSPYFHPSFAAAVAATRPGVRVIVGEDGLGAVNSFLPVQFDKRTCRPAGFPAADFQGPICSAQADYDIGAAIRGVGASSYRFDHMRDGIAGVEPWIVGRQHSPYIDISGGMDGYLSRASKSGKDNIGQARRRSRKAERELGAVRFVADSNDEALLDTVIALKRRQYSATGARDYFADAGHVGLLRGLFNTREAEFSGALSAVFAGPHLLAAHFGLRSGPILHWWFPVYDHEYSRFAPGWLLLRALIQAAPDLGLARIDLGRGDDEYKRRAMTGYQSVCQGAVVPNPWRHQAQRVCDRAIDAVKSSPVAPALRSAVHYSRSRRG
jgi:CelD/BcsL family acetyltransferase involved in cellulose biosynthesis